LTQNKDQSSGQDNQNTAGPAQSDQTSPSSVSLVGKTVAQIIQTGQTLLADNPTGAFYNYVNEAGGPAQFISYENNAALQNSFVNAFKNGSLTVQDVTQIPQLQFTDNEFFTGQGESGSAGWNTNIEAEMDAANGTYSTGVVFPGIGALYVTWANPSVETSKAAPETTQG